MKGLRVWVLLTLLGFNYFACTKADIKPPPAPEDPFIAEAINYLREHTAPPDFETLDLLRPRLITIPGSSSIVARFIDRNDVNNSATIVKTEKGLSGNWFKMTATDEKRKQATLHSASLDKRTDRKLVMENNAIVRIDSKVDGVVKSLRLKAGSRNIFVDEETTANKYNPDDDETTGLWLPDFVIIGYSLRDPTPYYSLFWLTEMNPLFIRAFVPGKIVIDPESLNGGPTGVPAEAVEPSSLDFDNLGNRVKVRELMKCFDNIPNAGAKYSITLYSDIPVNSDPSKLVDGFTPGHSFLSFTKANGSNSITQVFGFYPVTSALSVFSVAVASVVVDNGAHEYNSSITMPNLSEALFTAAEKLAEDYSQTKEYDLNDFNCTDFAVGVFNKARSSNDQIAIPDWYTQLTHLNYGLTPNGLHEVLKNMKNKNGKEAENIHLGTFKANSSKGPCK